MLDDLRDIESDMSAIHRIDDMYALPAPKFFALCQRLPAYRGAVAARLAIHHNNTQHPGFGGELTAEEVEAHRNAHRIKTHPRALKSGEHPQYVPLQQLLRQ